MNNKKKKKQVKHLQYTMATVKHPGSKREELSHGKERTGLNKATTKGHKHHLCGFLSGIWES